VIGISSSGLRLRKPSRRKILLKDPSGRERLSLLLTLMAYGGAFAGGRPGLESEGGKEAVQPR